MLHLTRVDCDRTSLKMYPADYFLFTILTTNFNIINYYLMPPNLA